VKEIAGQYTVKAIKTLAAIMDDPMQPSAARVDAGQLLDRGHGRPRETQDQTVADQPDQPAYTIAPEDSNFEFVAKRCNGVVDEG
jgi:hypothetical protein